MASSSCLPAFFHDPGASRELAAPASPRAKQQGMKRSLQAPFLDALAIPLNLTHSVKRNPPQLACPCKVCYESRMKPFVRPALCLISCLCWMGCGQTTPSITLHQAVEQGSLKAVQQHIAAKTDLNKPNTAGWTSLHLAAMKGDLAMVQALSAAGTDVKRKGKAGKTPLDVARERGQTAIVQFLQPRYEKRGRALIDGGLGVSEVLDNP